VLPLRGCPRSVSVTYAKYEWDITLHVMLNSCALHALDLGWYSECVLGSVFVGAIFGGDFTGPSQGDQTESIPVERQVDLGACLRFPSYWPTKDGCEGLSKEKYMHEAELAWTTLVDLVDGCGVDCRHQRVAFSRQFGDPNLRWYGCQLTLHSMSRVVSDMQWVDEEVVSTMTGLVSYASIHARRTDGSCRFACVPCQVLTRERDSPVAGWLVCNTLKRLLPKVDSVFVPVSLGTHFTLIHCHVTGPRLMSYYDTLCFKTNEETVLATFRKNAKALVSVLFRHGLCTVFNDWQLEVVPHFPVVHLPPKWVEDPSKWPVDKNPLACPVQDDYYNCGPLVIAIVECLVSGKRPGAINDYKPHDNYRKHMVWMLMHWHVNGAWPGYVADWCKDLS
jgi:hypothetical protein